MSESGSELNDGMMPLAGPCWPPVRLGSPYFCPVKAPEPVLTQLTWSATFGNVSLASPPASFGPTPPSPAAPWQPAQPAVRYTWAPRTRGSTGPAFFGGLKANA